MSHEQAATANDSNSARRRFRLLAVVVILAVASSITWFLVYLEFHLPDWIPDPAAATKKNTAITQLKVLTNACEEYKIKHNKFPESLQVLSMKDEFGNIYVDDAAALNDPWNRPFQYDARGPNNQGMKPDIWFRDEKNRKDIGNWPKQK